MHKLEMTLISHLTQIDYYLIISSAVKGAPYILEAPEE